MIDFPIIDSRIHLLDRQRFGYSWSSGSSWATAATKLNRDWTADDLSSCSKPYHVQGFVFVEADVDAPQYLDEAEWVASAAQSGRRIMACVACLPLEKGLAIESEMARIASLQRVRGVRRLIQNMHDLTLPVNFGSLNWSGDYATRWFWAMYQSRRMRARLSDPHRLSVGELTLLCQAAAVESARSARISGYNSRTM